MCYPKCYNVDPTIDFPVMMADDENGILLEEEAENVYNHARIGDQYITMFMSL